jgi:hypothetical protein
MTNHRLFYPCISFAIAQESTTSFSFMHGIQQLGMDSNVQLDQIFELSQISIYENKESLPTANLTVQKVLDGYCPVFLAATQGASAATLAGRSTPKCNAVIGTYPETNNSAIGVPITEVYLSGLFINSVAYNFPVDGQYNENVTMFCYDKIWRDVQASGLTALASGTFTNTDVPLAITGSGGVQRRQNFVWACSSALATRDSNGMVQTGATAATQLTILPPDIDGISSSGTNDKTGDTYGAHVQDITVNVDFNRPDLFEQGRKGPYFKPVAFPVQVSTSISAIATKWDNFSFTQTGMLGDGTGNNLKPRTIKIKTQEGLFIDLGTNNKLVGSNWGGGGTDGANVVLTYNYITFNDMTVTHPQDATTSLRQG